MALQTEFDFELPRGYIDKDGNLHRSGAMRLATGGDEIVTLKDPRVKQNPAYLAIIVLSRVVIRLGELEMITPKVIEDMFTADVAYLQDFYQRINQNGKTDITVKCPKCDHAFEVDPIPFAVS